MLASLVMTGAASLAVGGWRTLEAWQLGLLAASSVSGIMIASTTYFAAIYTAGPRLTALLFSLAAPFAVILGAVVLGETVSTRQAIGILVVLVGIVITIGLKPGRLPADVPWKGIALGVITALGQAGGSLFARPAMAAGVEPFTAMAVRSGLAACFFIALMLVPIKALNPSYRFAWRDLGTGVAAAFFGTGLGMSLLMAALVRGNVGIVSTLSSMTPVMILPMVWARSGKAPPRRAWLGALLAVAGTALISVG